ncbi:Caffeoyl CoA O-methyltransferase2 [Zea mays]|uniref:Caffeoyl CoA O-methyltransferase2 n=1 Tax=Zea mays TaxID=4577 RepID=A0A1D6NUK6_MAIZE|nr:Caffeoyl CoA O-methyltransferase2 [Zea mays]
MFRSCFFIRNCRRFSIRKSRGR